MICLPLQLVTSYQENEQANTLLSVDCRPIAVIITFWSCWEITVVNKKASIRWQDSALRISFQATGPPVCRTQASDAMTSRLLHYEAKCVQCCCFQCGSVPLRSDIKGTELPPANILIPLERQLIVLQLCRWELLYDETLQQTFRPLLSKLSKRRQI